MAPADTTAVTPAGNTTVIAPADTTVIAPADTTVIAATDTVKVSADSTAIAPADTAAIAHVETSAVPAAVSAAVSGPRPIIAASTNVLYDLGGLVRPLSWTPNFAVEYPIGQKWSVYAEYAFPWWVTDANNQAWQILKWDIGARRWLSRHNADDRMDVLRGHFVGIDLGAGYYDIEPMHTGYQGEFQTVGLEYGYAFRLGQAWRLDLFGGIGWLGTHYRYYEGDSSDVHLLYQHNGKLQWFGPVKAGVSIKYIFHKNDRREDR